MNTELLAQKRFHWVAPAVGLFALFLKVSAGFAQGIPEPPLLLYGAVVDNRTNTEILKTNGVLRVVFSSASETNTYTTALQFIDAKHSYILALPVETPIPNFQESPNHLRLKSSPITYAIADVSLDGQKLFISRSDPVVFKIDSEARGSLRLLNLVFVSPSSEDSDHNGLADEWERRYFGGIGVNPLGDPDRDGRTNLQEFTEGTDPKDSTFLNITILNVTPSKVRLAWESIPGREYTIEQAKGVFFGAPTVVQQGLAGSGGELFFEVEMGPSQQFFRLKE